MATEHEEVVIDGDSTEDEEEVRIITPKSRKRSHHSNVITEKDEEEIEMEEEKTEKPEEQATKASSYALKRQQKIYLAEEGVISQRMTLRSSKVTRSSRRNHQQLSISAAVARGERGRRVQEEDDKEDDIRIVHTPPISSITSIGSSGRKCRRPRVQDNDEEVLEGRQFSERKQIDQTDEISSASRRSLRIRNVKKTQQGIPRRLDYPALENCLDNLQSLGPHYEGDDDDDHNYEDSELEETLITPNKKRRLSVPRLGERDNVEKFCADSGNDVDDFICDDDEIEYMEEGEEGVISVESSDDEIEDNPEELTAMLEAGRSREISEWFTIYLEFLEECIIDPGFEKKMLSKRLKPKHQLYDQAVNHIERKLCSCREAVRSGVAWPEEMLDALKRASVFRSSHASAEQDCDACNRRQHVATYHVEFAGVACDATKLYGQNWMGCLENALEEPAFVEVAFEMGSVCHARTLAYWQLLHAKRFWCIIVDAKLKECANDMGRIAEQYRTDFFTKEFGRYKKLVSLVEMFAEDSKRITAGVPNVWRKISAHKVISDFLPLRAKPSPFMTSKARRGTLDAIVAESEEEGTEDEEAVMEKMEQSAAVDFNGDNQAANIEEKVKKGKDPLPSSIRPLESKKEQRNELVTEDKHGEQDLRKNDKEKDIDDLMCLVCEASTRNAGVVHGLYLHVYCCYACAKRQYRTKSGCMVCNRSIDRVLRLLPLTLDARNAIRNQQKS
ncbi:hypothetical protein PsorP6_000342 [Peronosclerospora sorghi]|uniref:Uncharacterized protein n=1 Tax=Peronosclerospora sorghi TaxID=230839 RepID=A0ACC0WS41_9STRA|nr:hypothetical protein PsorP6_000342 [Peronosclerospora sorghi]